jgi:hypothetical protein
VPSKEVSIKNVPSKEVSIKNVPSKEVSIKNVPSKEVSIKNVPSEEEKYILPMFKQLIVDELNKILKNVPSEKVVSIENVPSKEEKYIFLPKFKQLIVEELNKIFPNPVVKNPAEKPAEKLIVQQKNAQINDNKNYFIKKKEALSIDAKNEEENERNGININDIQLSFNSTERSGRKAEEAKNEEENERNGININDIQLSFNSTERSGRKAEEAELEAENKRKAELEAENKRKADADAQAKAKAELEKNNLINDKEIKYDTEYSTSVIRNKKNFNIKNEMVVLYRHKIEIVRGIIENFKNVKPDIDITINKKSYKLITMDKAIDENVFTYFDSLMFIKSEAMQVPQNSIDSDFDNLLKSKMQFYSDINLKQKTKLDNKHKTGEGPQSYHEPHPGISIYVNTNDWNQYIEDAKYEKVTEKINYKEGINYYLKEDNGTYKQKNGKILSVTKSLFGNLSAILTNNSKIKDCNNCYIKKTDKNPA